METYNERFLLHYNFPPYATGETSMLRAPKRREIGHGMLARRAVKAILPSETVFPYTIRVVSDVMESNGSSSMASVCGGCLALMDAGVPITAPVAGIAMGLLQQGDKFVILTDILGDEDHFGEMDFKVAGTREGITALQMDIKVPGIPTEVMYKALDQAKAGRLHILDRMAEFISTPRPELSATAPRIVQIKIPVDRIGKVIGPGGKMIRAIQEETGARIDIEDDGTVSIAAVGGDKIRAARTRIEELTMVPEVGKLYDGTVVSVREFGAFVRIGPDVEGLCHVSELTEAYIKDVGQFINIGDSFRVKVISIDDDGKIRLSRKQAITSEGGEDALAEEVRIHNEANPGASQRPRRTDGPRGGDRGGRPGGRSSDRGRDRRRER
jgi:polyribonucleotide nucleotidyltransferase